MKKSHRRRLYYKMFIVYVVGLFMPNSYKCINYIDLGFCFYLINKKINFLDLNELKLQEPKDDQKPNDYIGYWFPMGHLRPRIKCLIKAIILTYKK